VIHPDHDFILLDDLIKPSLMIVQLTPAFPHRFYSELEDKRREHVAADVQQQLESHGLKKVEIRWEHESDSHQEVKAPPPVVESRNPLLRQLTEEQSAFWLRFCSISGTSYESLNQTAHNHIAEWSNEIKTQEDLQRLYDVADQRIRSLCAANNQAYVAPRLGNLKNALPDWRMRAQKPPSEQKGHVVSGSGQTRNATYERLDRMRRGEQVETFSYAPVSRSRNTTANSGPSSIAAILQQISLRRNVQQGVQTT
jgi:hypothetical protein